MALASRAAAGLLVGAGGAGAVTMLPLLLAGPGAQGTEPGRVAALAFALLLSVPLAIGVNALLRPAAGAPAGVRGLVTFATLFWLGGLGADLFNPGAGPSFLAAANAAALLGGLAFVGAGVWVLQGPGSRRERRSRARGRQG